MRRVALALALCLVAGCGTKKDAVPTANAVTGAAGSGGSGPTCDGGRTVGGVITYGAFARILADGLTADGLDVDGVTSDGTDAASCYKKDFVGPDGTPGIDNQFGTLLPLIEAAVGTENVAKLLDAAIADGQLLIVVTVSGVDDIANDDCVTVRLGAGAGAPLLDTQGKYLPYQTFGFDRTAADVSVLSRGRIVNGVLDAHGDILLPVRVLDANFNLLVHGGEMRLTLTPDDGGGAYMEGLAGGGIGVTDFKTIIMGLNIGENLIKGASAVIGGTADLAPDSDGRCTQVSAALAFRMTPAYVLDGAAP